MIILSVLMQCFGIACVSSILWLMVGYSIAFGTGNAFWGGLGDSFLTSVSEDSISGDIPTTVFVMFQMTFAVITPSLIIGGFAERTKINSKSIESDPIDTFKGKLKIDDSLDVMPVHGVGGILGTMAAGIFASSELGLFSGQGLDRSIGAQLGVQATGVIATIAYTAIVTYVLLKIVDILVGLRVSAEDEAEGLDISLHNESGYDL